MIWIRVRKVFVYIEYKGGYLNQAEIFKKKTSVIKHTVLRLCSFILIAKVLFQVGIVLLFSNIEGLMPTVFF